MQGHKTTGRLSLLHAFLLSMLGVSTIFILLTMGIWVYTSEVLRREKTLISELLPELDVTFQLTAATAGLQSQVLFLLSSNNTTELEHGSLKVGASIAKTLSIVDSLAISEASIGTKLNASVNKLAQITRSVVTVKQRQFGLQQRLESEKLRILDVLTRLQQPVHEQVGRLTRKLQDISRQIAEFDPSNNLDTASSQQFSNRVLEFELANLAIQDYLRFGQDVASLTSIVEAVPLLTSSESVKAGIRSRGVLLNALVGRSNAITDEASIAILLALVDELRTLLDSDENLFEIQKKIIRQEVVLASLGELMRSPIESMLSQSDNLRDETRSIVSVLAEKTLAGLESYKNLAIAVGTLVLLLIAAISYWLVYRKTVLPLVEITEQLDHVGSESFPVAARPYFLKELSTLSSAMMQLHEAQQSLLVNDMKMQKINDHLQRANAELEQFAHVASHDLQEPLRKMQQFSDLLDEDYGERLDDDGRYFIESIRNSARRMSNLIRDTLAFSRAGSGEQLLEPVDLSHLFLQLRDEIEVAITDAQGEITVDDLPVVFANPLGMAQLFQNLLTNALKYRKPGTPARVSVTVIRAQNDHAFALVIRVQDNGVGIDPKFQQRIFKPFERLKSDGVRGTGLGLAICRKVCEAHQWGLEVSSEPGVGTCFDIRIPGHGLHNE